MVHRWLPALVATTTVAVALTMLGPAAPAARRDGHFSGSVSTTTVPGGSTTVTSATVPKVVDAIDVLVGEEVGSTRTFKNMAFTMMVIPPKKRVVSCLVMAARDLEQARERLYDFALDEEQVEAAANTRAAAFVVMCVRITRLMAELEAEGSVRAERAARNRCSLAPLSLKVRTERTDDGGYLLTPVGSVKDATRTLPATITCQGTSSKLKLHVKRTKKSTVRKAVGRNVRMSVVSPPDAPGDAHITVGFT